MDKLYVVMPAYNEEMNIKEITFKSRQCGKNSINIFLI